MIVNLQSMDIVHLENMNRNNWQNVLKKLVSICLMIIGKTAFIQELYKDYIVDEYDKKYRFKLHSGRVGDEINTRHLVIKNLLSYHSRRISPTLRKNL